jgi:hypothetical protein
MTRAAPFRPKIDHDRLCIACGQNFRFKISIVNRWYVFRHVLCPQQLARKGSPPVSP